MSKEILLTADGLKDVYCSDCNEVGGNEIIPARGHVIELVRTVDAKCTVDGYKDYKCANTATDEYLTCSHTEREILNMLGHDHQYVLEKEPT